MSFENRYSTMDRLLHRFAFASAPAQIVIADMEDRQFASRLEPITILRPVFVTALPRAGTTILLEAIEALPEFASHTYRNMPFVLCPMLWDRFSSRFQGDMEAQERAHKDGILITPDSPEAFEEMLWKAFFRKQYGRDRIHLWTDDDPDFFEFFRNNMRKIIALREGASRYLSKNNLNIARIAQLSKNFEDGLIIVPFRDPLQHAASLLAQHENFLEIHADDSFSRHYMAGIGHYDFGENLRPVDFNGWIDRAHFADATTLRFWLEYWFETYRYLAEQEGVHFLCYEDLCAEPVKVLAALTDILQPADTDSLVRAADRFRAPREHAIALETNAAALLDDARGLYQALRDR